MATLFIPLAFAQNAAQTPAMIQACQHLYPEFVIPPEENLDSPGEFNAAFEAFQSQYHNYVECVFSVAVQTILGSSGADTEGLFSANAPNFPEWLVPDISCLEFSKLQEVTTNTATDTLLPGLLKVYNAYTKALADMHAKYQDSLFTNGKNLSAIRQAKDRASDELEASLTALHTAFMQLIELRQVFVLHVQFQCILKNLEEYRKVLDEIRKVIILLPVHIIDASETR